MQDNQLVGKRILLAEDECGFREVLRTVLSEDRHVVVEANNGAEALSCFRKQPFDLVLIDFEMPFMKGDELAVRIKQLAPHQPVLMLTGHARKPGRDNPVDAILHKPFDFNRLRRVMASLLPEDGNTVASAAGSGHG